MISMRRLISTLLILLALTFTIQAQSPQSFSYQAVPRDANGNVMPNQNISLKISIMEGSSSGTVVYAETHTTMTNDQGIVNLKIGDGTTTMGTFSSINWGNHMHYVMVEMDPNGGTNYQTLGTSMLSSVPYAMYAQSAANTFSGDYNDLVNTPNLHTIATSGDYTDLMNKPNMSNYIEIANPSAGDLAYYDGSTWSKLPAGNSGNIMRIDNSGMPSWSSAPTGDNMGNHEATQDIILDTFSINYDQNAPAINLEPGLFGGVHIHDQVKIGTNSNDLFAVLKIAGEIQDWNDLSYSLDPSDISYIKDLNVDGYIEMEDSSIIGNSSSNMLFDYNNFNLVVKSADIVQDSNAFYDIGNSGQAWDDVYANQLVTSSDKNLKNNIQQLNYGLDEIMKLQPVSYKYKNDPKVEKTRMGLIAQNVKPVIDNAVVEYDIDRDPETGEITRTKNPYLGIDYVSLVPVLINGIQEQQNKIDKLESQVESMEQRLKQLENMVENQ